MPNIGEGMGKKIVEALKMQTSEDMNDNEYNESYEETSYATTSNEDSISTIQNDMNYNSQSEYSQSFIDNALQHSIEQNIGIENNYSIINNTDTPANVAILKQLITKLPSGVSKQTGAIIIKQTMEALGISMNGVLQEAKQTRDNLANNAKECQNNIVEYRKQISIMESKAQQYQKESAILNDIINVFLQTGVR